MAEYSDEQFLEYVVKAIVDSPDDVKVNRQVDEMGVLLTLKVSPKDMGQVVGRQGSTAKAIRSLLKIVGIKNNARVNLKIEEPEGGRKFTRESAEPEPSKASNFDGTTVGKVIDDIKKDL
ncbi:MAG: KH domain-containing protein [Candidatus Colwellbacteria bacterium]|nr:KH domain-containing protein [Candidatus Colwellbacteria bacterium]